MLYAFLDWTTIPVLLAVLVGGWVLYEGYARIHGLSRPDDDIQELIEKNTGTGEFVQAEPGAVQVLVAADESAAAIALLELAQRLCGKRPHQLRVLHLLTVAEEARLSDAARNVSQAMDFVRTVLKHFSNGGVPLKASVRCARSAARGILTTARESATDLIVLGWHGRIQRGQPAAWGKTLDPVLRRAPCPVVIAKGIEGPQPFRRILVPLIEARHSAFALHLASRMAAAQNSEDDEADSEIELFSVQTGGRPEEMDVREFLRRNARRVVHAAVRIVCRSEICGSVVDGVLEEILRGRHDLVVLGAMPPEQAQMDEEASISTRIAIRSRIPCLMVTAVGPGWSLRWTRGKGSPFGSS